MSSTFASLRAASLLAPRGLHLGTRFPSSSLSQTKTQVGMRVHSEKDRTFIKRLVGHVRPVTIWFSPILHFKGKPVMVSALISIEAQSGAPLLAVTEGKVPMAIQMVEDNHGGSPLKKVRTLPSPGKSRLKLSLYQWGVSFQRCHFTLSFSATTEVELLQRVTLTENPADAIPRQRLTEPQLILILSHPIRWGHGSGSTHLGTSLKVGVLNPRPQGSLGSAR